MSMTREEIKKAAEVMLAYVDGKKIECGCSSGLWVEVDPPAFNWAENNYRIKPEPKYRPFRTQEECWNEMHRHPDFGWVKCVYIDEIVHINSISSPNIPLCFRLSNVSTNYSADLVFRDYTFTDGTPFGIKEE